MKLNITFILFMYLVMDLIWISTNYKMYNEAVFKIQNKKINLRAVSAIIAYVLLIINIYFILIPYTKKLKTQSARIIAFALSGLVIYGVYNSTTYAIIDNYPLHVAIIDTLWGAASHTALALAIEYFN
jgi:uncharacterized membrane protein